MRTGPDGIRARGREVQIGDVSRVPAGVRVVHLNRGPRAVDGEASPGRRVGRQAPLSDDGIGRGERSGGLGRRVDLRGVELHSSYVDDASGALRSSCVASRCGCCLSQQIRDKFRSNKNKWL